jgi:hypothetical protein
MRGEDVLRSSRSADHVDMLGNDELIYDVLKIAAGRRLDSRIHSNIREISEEIKLEELDV